MRITVLGSGTAIPETDRFPACVLVQGGGETILVDLGPGALRRLPIDKGSRKSLLLDVPGVHGQHLAELIPSLVIGVDVIGDVEPGLFCKPSASGTPRSMAALDKKVTELAVLARPNAPNIGR